MVFFEQSIILFLAATFDSLFGYEEELYPISPKTPYPDNNAPS